MAALLLLSAVPDVLRIPGAMLVFKRLGYPPYLVVFLGTAKILGVAAVLVPGFPRIKEWAFAGLTFDVTGALYSHLSIGDPPGAWTPAVVALALVGGSYVAYRMRRGRDQVLMNSEPASDRAPAMEPGSIERVSLRYSIMAARPQDLGRLPAIELAAARLLAGHAPESVLNETTSPIVLKNALHERRLWVALADDVAVGFAHVEVIERETAHLEEIDVDPEHGRQGLGTRLVLQVCDWAASHGYASVTLTTFRDVPWNMRFYARLGFGVVAPEHLSLALRAVVEDETRRGLDPSRRVVMRRPVRARARD